VLRYLEVFGIVVTIACYETTPPSQPPLFKTFMSCFFLHFLSSHHKSTPPCLHHYFRWHGRMGRAGLKMRKSMWASLTVKPVEAALRLV
jgi:hypothetical protein